MGEGEEKTSPHRKSSLRKGRGAEVRGRGQRLTRQTQAGASLRGFVDRGSIFIFLLGLVVYPGQNGASRKLSLAAVLRGDQRG